MVGGDCGCGSCGVASLAPAQDSNVRAAALPVYSPSGLSPSGGHWGASRQAGLVMVASCPSPVLPQAPPHFLCFLSPGGALLL